MPGFLAINYKSDKELLEIMKKIFQRENYKKEPFYLSKCENHPTQSIFKGKECLNCLFASYLHAA